MLFSLQVARPHATGSVISPPRTILVVPHGCRTITKSRNGAGSRSIRRFFSWRSKRSGGDYSNPSLYKSSLSYDSTGGKSYSKILYRSYSWKRGHFLNHYTQSPEWRLISSWGRPSSGSRSSEKASKDRPAHEESTRDDWYNAWQGRHRATLKQFDDFQKLIDEDPYKALFGDNLPERWFSLRHRYVGSKDTDRRPKSPPEPVNSNKAGPTEAKSSEMPQSTNRKPPNTNVAPPATGGESESFVIDPITMRKISKPISKESRTAQKGSDTANGQPWGYMTTERPLAKCETASEQVDIPVKTLGTPTVASVAVDTPRRPQVAVEKAPKGKQDWLVKEGFGKTSKIETTPPGKDVAKPNRIESALDRYRGKPRTMAFLEPKQYTKMTYDPKEIQTDDVDLLTASDIRASAGRAGRASKDTVEMKEHRRDLLEKDYRERPQDLEAQLKGEIELQKSQSEETLMRELQQIAEEQRRRDAARTAHEEEVRDQKAAMETHEIRRGSSQQSAPVASVQQLQQGEGDMASNVHEFHGRDRWYKRKAPHASGETEQKLRQLTKDKAFVREIRGIYEDTYGTIDTKHRQSPLQASTDISEYPSDACPGTVYEQPWSANVLNDHPDVEAKETNVSTEDSYRQDRTGKQKHEGLSLIGKLFNEMRENQALIHEYRDELQRISTRDQSQNLLQNLKAHEQRIMYTLKQAQGLFKSASVPTMTTAVSETAVPSAMFEGSDTDAAKSQQSTTEEDLPAPPALYKILAYDPSSDKVVTTRTSNLVGPVTAKTLTFSEALFGLKNPAKFLPHFHALTNGEYEVAAGGPNLLIFKKLRQLRLSPEEQAPEDSKWHANPIDGMIAPNPPSPPTGNFASPTGFINFDPTPPEPQRQAPAEFASSSAKGKDKIRRQEDVFSGSSRRAWHDQHERGSHIKAQLKNKQRRAKQRRKTVKRMVLVGAMTAAGCYAVGVASEFLRL